MYSLDHVAKRSDADRLVEHLKAHGYTDVYANETPDGWLVGFGEDYAYDVLTQADRERASRLIEAWNDGAKV